MKIHSQENGGVSRARNAGLALATGDFIMFLDADDMLHPTALERLHRALNEHPQSILAYGRTRYVGPDGRCRPGDHVEQPGGASGDILAEMILRRKAFWNGGQALVRASVAKNSGGYSEGIKLSEDWEFFCRLVANGDCVALSPESEEVFYHRVRHHSLSNAGEGVREPKTVYRKVVFEPCASLAV